MSSNYNYDVPKLCDFGSPQIMFRWTRQLPMFQPFMVMGDVEKMKYKIGVDCHTWLLPNAVRAALRSSQVKI